MSTPPIASKGITASSASRYVTAYGTKRAELKVSDVTALTNESLHSSSVGSGICSPAAELRAGATLPGLGTHRVDADSYAADDAIFDDLYSPTEEETRGNLCSFESSEDLYGDSPCAAEEEDEAERGEGGKKGGAREEMEICPTDVYSFVAGRVGTRRARIGFVHVRGETGGNEGKRRAEVISPWHHITLVPPVLPPDFSTDHLLFHCVCTTPAGTWLKHDIATAPESLPETLESLKLSSSSRGADGRLRAPRYRENSPFNIGFLPQTYADPTVSDNVFGDLPGNGRPIEVIDISGANSSSCRRCALGEAYLVKALAIYVVVEEGTALGWRLVAVNEFDPLFKELNATSDLNRELPGRLKQVREWLRRCDCLAPDDPDTTFGLNARPANEAVALSIVQRCHATWLDFVGQFPPPHPHPLPLSSLSLPYLSQLFPSSPAGKGRERESETELFTLREKGLADDLVQLEASLHSWMRPSSPAQCPPSLSRSPNTPPASASVPSANGARAFQPSGPRVLSHSFSPKLVREMTEDLSSLSEHSAALAISSDATHAVAGTAAEAGTRRTVEAAPRRAAGRNAHTPGASLKDARSANSPRRAHVGFCRSSSTPLSGSPSTGTNGGSPRGDFPSSPSSSSHAHQTHAPRSPLSPLSVHYQGSESSPRSLSSLSASPASSSSRSGNSLPFAPTLLSQHKRSPSYDPSSMRTAKEGSSGDEGGRGGRERGGGIHRQGSADFSFPVPPSCPSEVEIRFGRSSSVSDIHPSDSHALPTVRKSRLGKATSPTSDEEAYSSPLVSSSSPNSNSSSGTSSPARRFSSSLSSSPSSSAPSPVAKDAHPHAGTTRVPSPALHSHPSFSFSPRLPPSSSSSSFGAFNSAGGRVPLPISPSPIPKVNSFSDSDSEDFNPTTFLGVREIEKKGFRTHHEHHGSPAAASGAFGSEDLSPDEGDLYEVIEDVQEVPEFANPSQVQQQQQISPGQVGSGANWQQNSQLAGAHPSAGGAPSPFLSPSLPLPPAPPMHSILVKPGIAAESTRGGIVGMGGGGGVGLDVSSPGSSSGVTSVVSPGSDTKRVRERKVRFNKIVEVRIFSVE